VTKAGEQKVEIEPCAFPKVIVAVHGIGTQQRNVTIQSVANRLATDEQITLQLPLGFFHGKDREKVQVRPVWWKSRTNVLRGGAGFAEVFWADIPAAVAKQQDTLEESRAWAATFVARVTASDDLGNEVPPENLEQVGFVLGDMIEAITVVENLMKVIRAVGLFNFELKQVLDDFLGDVQLVGEYADTRREITDRFAERMLSLCHPPQKPDGLRSTRRRCHALSIHCRAPGSDRDRWLRFNRGSRNGRSVCKLYRRNDVSRTNPSEAAVTLPRPLSRS
jgi:hypothetical protein